MAIQSIGVVGAGVMGRGVAQNIAQSGYRVVLLDISPRILEHAEHEISENIRLQSLFAKGEPTVDTGKVLDRIEFSVEYHLLANVGFVVENVTENWEVKKDVYTRLSSVCREGCVIAANTSAIPVTRLASVTNRPSRVIGMHFMNPVPLIKTVEVIRGALTSDETVESAKMLLKQMGKEMVVVKDSPGFVSNRVLMLMINEAIFLLQEQVAEARDVDLIFKSCFGHKMGPLETADLIGLDTVLNSIEVLQESFNDSKYSPCPLLIKLVQAGQYGRKSGQGFYKYPVPLNQS